MLDSVLQEQTQKGKGYPWGGVEQFNAMWQRRWVQMPQDIQKKET